MLPFSFLVHISNRVQSGTRLNEAEQQVMSDGLALAQAALTMSPEQAPPAPRVARPAAAHSSGPKRQLA